MAKKITPATDATDAFDDGLDVPLAKPEVRTHDVQDAFDYDTAVNFAFIGVGQGGGRLAATFHKLGYRRVCVVNTDHADLADLPADIPKLDLQTGGAGKDPRRGAAAVRGQEQAIHELMTRSFGKQVDYLLVCAGLGGGTGSGAGPRVFELAQKFMEDRGGSSKRVGAVVTLPHSAEGQTPCRNAVHAFQQFRQGGAFPLLIVDNKRIGEVYQRGVSEFFSVANDQVAKLLHLFNRLAAQKSSITTFDRADFATLLDAGICVLGASEVGAYSSPADFSATIRQHLQSTILAEVDYSQGAKAGCVFTGPDELLRTIPMDFFDGGFSMLTRLLAEGSVVHRGIYPGGKSLRCYTILAGLPSPEATLQRLAKEGRISGLAEADSIAKFLGID